MMTSLPICFMGSMEIRLASAEPQRFATIGPHSFGFPPKLESGNVLNWPTFGTGPSEPILTD